MKLAAKPVMALMDRLPEEPAIDVGTACDKGYWPFTLRDDESLFPVLEKLFADSAYQGPLFASGLAKILPCLKAEIIKRPDQAKGFVRLPKLWIVERTIAWLNRCRRLAKDWENLNRNALAFLKLASIRLMLRKLCNP
jgi:transposase